MSINVAIARSVVNKKAPYFAAALLGFCYSETDEVPTTAVTPNGRILYNKQWFETLTPSQGAFCLVHEYLHIVQRVFDRRGDRDHTIWNIAADLAINPLIAEMGFDAPIADKAPVMPEQFKLPHGLIAEEYYRLLMKNAKKITIKLGSGVGQGHCSHGDHEQDGKGDKKPHLDDRTKAEIERVIKGVAEAVRQQNEKQRGTVPAGMDRWADTELKPPTVPWQQVLAHAVRQSIATRIGATTRKYDAPSRRQAALGHGQGKPVLARWRKTVPNVVVAFDTSGSMNDKDLNDCLSELQGILSAIGSRVTFMSCDAQVHAVGEIQNVRQASKLIKGGGGTSFTPIFEAAEKLKPTPGLIILLSDGYGDNPPEIKWARTIVALIGGNKKCSITWAEVVHVGQ